MQTSRPMCVVFWILFVQSIVLGINGLKVSKSPLSPQNIKQSHQGQEFDIHISNLVKSSGHNDFKICHDTTENLVYVYTWNTGSDGKISSSTYVVDLKNGAADSVKIEKRAADKSVDKMFCQSGLFVFTIVGDQKTYVRSHQDNKFFGQKVGKVESVVFSDKNARDVALVTKKNKAPLI
ncbi:hypothetical protein RF11_00263 [Thelohanellus kitauei]|uniref:Uncharacterized protein n=1 Tax=Thelohanellus kitauei TaxID=669202 RepID=A0A0C2N236_THEKT|nr:hypothetical protein RF11_00263 [Thelohanellus kitauei]